MISELTDEEILEFLMTSDLIDNFRPDDYKYLILKFRNFYKILHGKHQLYKTNSDALIKDLQFSSENLTSKLQNSETQRAILESEILELKRPRKLSVKERILGKTQ